MVDRRFAVRSAIGSVRAAGLNPATEVVARLEAYANEQLTADELVILERELLQQNRRSVESPKEMT